MVNQSPGYPLPEAPTYEELPTAKPRASRGGPELRELRVRLEVVTPILGGSHQTRAVDDVDIIRAASVRGQLRFWWRALYASQCPSAEKLYQPLVWGRAVRQRFRRGPATCCVNRSSMAPDSSQCNS